MSKSKPDKIPTLDFTKVFHEDDEVKTAVGVKTAKDDEPNYNDEKFEEPEEEEIPEVFEYELAVDDDVPLSDVEDLTIQKDEVNEEYPDDFESGNEKKQFFIPVIQAKNASKDKLYRRLKPEIQPQLGSIGPYDSREERNKAFKESFDLLIYYKTSIGWKTLQKIDALKDIKHDTWLVEVKKRLRLLDPTKSSAARAAGGKTKRRRQRKSVQLSIFSFPFACSKESFSRKTRKSKRKPKTRRRNTNRK